MLAWLLEFQLSYKRHLPYPKATQAPLTLKVYKAIG